MIETGVFFGNIHSFYDLNLILSGVLIPPATPKTNYVDVPGADGAVDLTEALGEVKYNDREGCKFTFSMNPADDLSEAAWEEKKTEVSNLLNGRKFNNITLDKDPDFYYTGRITVSEYLSNKRKRQIVVTGRLSPWKWKQNKTVVTFNLTESEKTVILLNGRKSVVPVFECTNDNTVVVFGGITKTMNAGTHKFLDICFKEGSNALKLSGTGTIKITYQEGEL